MKQSTVSIWEGIAIAAGAVLLIATGLAGLGVKALNNAFDPQRAKAIAQSLMEYEIPGGYRGVFGANIGGGKIAVVASTASVRGKDNELQSNPPPAIELLIAKVPRQADPSDGEDSSSVKFFPGFSFSYQAEESFQITNSHTEERPLCGVNTPVLIQEGWLTVSGAAPVPGMKYQASVVLDTDNHIAIISTLGQKAQANAAEVFNSLDCK